MKKPIPVILCLLLSLSLLAQPVDKKLEKKLAETVQGFDGEIGIFVKNLKNGKVAAINADSLFPTASIVKVPILLGITDKIRQGVMTYDSTFTYRYADSLLYPGEDILGEFKDGGRIRLKKLIMLMLTTSDNTASLWLQSLAGTGTRINAILDSLGYRFTRVNSRTPGREANRAQFGWGQTTPREIASIFENIYQQKIFSPYDCERMMRELSRNFWDEDAALSRIPPYISVFSKNGAVDASRNEVLLVNAPHNPYILSIFTKNNKDKRWMHDNQAWALTRKISTILWKYFEPDDRWETPRP